MPESRWPLWFQLACAMAAASIIVAAAAGYFMRVIETDYLRDELRRESLAAAQALSTGITSIRNANGSYDLAKLEERARRHDARIYSLALLDRDGREITRWVSGSLGENRDLLDEVVYFRVPTPIPGRPDSQLVVSWNVADQLARVEQHVDRIRSNVFVAIALLSGVLVLLVDLLVVRPVGTLREGLDRLMRGGSSRVVSLSRFAASELARLAHSVRELGRYQHELREVQDSLVEARRQAEQASEAKGRFLAVMSHEIRTPMNGVLGNLQLLDDRQLNNSQRALVGNARRAADSLLEIINEILDFSRIESGRMELERKEFPIEELLCDVASSISGLLNPLEVELVVDFDPALPERILGDPLRLRQVLTNLLGNAAKFTGAGEIVLQASVESGSTLQLTVRDSGIGIEPAQLALLFEPFTQADSSISRHYGGTGLGLSISRQLVELMGGAISVESEPGKGSVFRVQLPLQGCAPPRRFSAPGDCVAGVSADAPREYVVVLVDNRNSGAAVARALGSMGLVPLVVDDEAVAHEKIHEFDRRVYALIVDSTRALAQSKSALSATLRGSLQAVGAKIIVLLPPGVAIPADAIQEITVLKPVKRDELHDALSGALHDPQVGRPASSPGPHEAAMPGVGEVLLVDDNPMNVQVAQAMLERLSLAVETANSAEQALALLSERRFDVVLMDEQMPGMDGLEATRVLREREQRAADGGGPARHTIIVALTANANSDSQQRCLAAGMDGFLAKPVRRKALREMLARWISGMPADRAGQDAVGNG